MKRLTAVLPVLFVVGFYGAARVSPRSPDPMVVHEWGTITNRHLSNGTPQGRLNLIKPTEILPAFVHRWEPEQTRGSLQNSLAKTLITPGPPDVTMRLETPVIYFYAPAGSASLPPFDVSVRFRGGVINEFYPSAAASVAVDAERVASKMNAGLINSWWDGGVLDNYVVGRLRWTGVSLKESVRLPRTSSPVWLAPRQVRSTGVVVPSGEGEKYLFYRGVGHLDALVQTELSESDVRLRAPARLLWLDEPAMTITKLWMVDIRPDGSAAFRQREEILLAKNAPSQDLGRIPRFGPQDYSAGGLAALRESMKQSLVAAGLFEDEAEAMLETWKESYFGTPGLRIFYLVPSQWVDHFLPLQISVPHELTRVLVGRIDLLPPFN